MKTTDHTDRDSAELAAFKAGWLAHVATDPECDTMGFAPQTVEAAFAQWKGQTPKTQSVRDPLSLAFDLVAAGKWQEARDAFQYVLDMMQGNDPLGLIDDQMAFCQAMLVEQRKRN